jgi:hypothetical protein
MPRYTNEMLGVNGFFEVAWCEHHVKQCAVNFISFWPFKSYEQQKVLSLSNKNINYQLNPYLFSFVGINHIAQKVLSQDI